MTTLTAEIGTTPSSVNTVTRTCCGGIGTHTRDCLTVTPPPGADLVCGWEENADGGQPWRSVFGVDRLITDSKIRVYPTVVQLADGSIEDSGFSSPNVSISNNEYDTLSGLNSDQARELAAALLECAAELDGWVAR